MKDIIFVLSALLFITIFVATYATIRWHQYKLLLHGGFKHQRISGWDGVADDSYQAPDEDKWRSLTDSATRVKMLSNVKYYNLPDPEIVKEPKQVDWR